MATIKIKTFKYSDLETNRKKNCKTGDKLKVERFLSLTDKKRILTKIKMGTREWAKKEINCIKGCGTYCLYCYAKGIAKHYKRCIEETWKDMEINWNAVKKGYGKIRKESPQPHDIMFPTSHNIIIAEPYFSACTTVIDKLLEAGNTVLITIKPFLVTTIFILGIKKNYVRYS